MLLPPETFGNLAQIAFRRNKYGGRRSEIFKETKKSQR
jgi:hypothetical protein